MKSITLARLQLDGRHVTNLTFELEDARLASAAIKSGLNAKLYSGKPDGQVLDLVRQLARMRTDAYLFRVSAETAAPTLQLVGGLKRLRPDVKACFWGSVDDQAVQRTLADAGVLVAADATEEMLPLLGTYAGLAATVGEEQAFSPYLTGLVPLEAAVRLGLTAHQSVAAFSAEVALMMGQAFSPGGVAPLDAYRSSADHLLQIFEVLAEAKLPLQFELQAAVEACSPVLATLLPAAGVARIAVAGDRTRLPPEIDALGLPVRDDGVDGVAARAELYGRNGSMILHTGSYFDAKPSPAVYHLEVPVTLPPERRRAVYAWMSDSMAIRSAAVLTGPEELMQGVLAGLDGLSFAETGGWPKHTYAISRSKGGRAEVSFDGSSSSKQKIAYVPLRDLATTSVDAGTTTFVTMNDLEDADELARRLAVFHSTGAVNLPHPHRSVVFENSCRWMNYGACRVALLRRLQVSEDDRVRSCRDGGQVGVVGDSYERMLLNARQTQQMEEVRRGCATCAVRDQCSHCSQLPQAWGGRYCELRNAYPHTALYFELSGLPYLLGKFLPASADDIDLRVSSSGLPLQHYTGQARAGRDGARPIIVSAADLHVAWWRGTRRLMRLSRPLALLAEAWWSGGEEPEITAALQHQFSVTADIAKDSYAAGMAKLQTGGVTHA